jgi:hypothetical protein
MSEMAGSEQGDAAQLKADPQSPIGSGEERRNIGRWQGFIGGAGVTYELKSIETGQTRLTTNPQYPIRRLRQGQDLAWGAAGHHECPVIHLLQRQIGFQRPHGAAVQ